MEDPIGIPTVDPRFTGQLIEDIVTVLKGHGYQVASEGTATVVGQRLSVAVEALTRVFEGESINVRSHVQAYADTEEVLHLLTSITTQKETLRFINEALGKLNSSLSELHALPPNRAREIGEWLKQDPKDNE